MNSAQFDADMNYKNAALKQDDDQFNATLANNKEQAAKNYALDLADRGIVDYLAKEMGKDPNEVYQMLLNWVRAGYDAQYNAQYGLKAAYTAPKTSTGVNSTSTSSGSGGNSAYSGAKF